MATSEGKLERERLIREFDRPRFDEFGLPWTRTLQRAVRRVSEVVLAFLLAALAVEVLYLLAQSCIYLYRIATVGGN